MYINARSAQAPITAIRCRRSGRGGRSLWKGEGAGQGTPDPVWWLLMATTAEILACPFKRRTWLANNKLMLLEVSLAHSGTLALDASACPFIRDAVATFADAYELDMLAHM